MNPLITNYHSNDDVCTDGCVCVYIMVRILASASGRVIIDQDREYRIATSSIRMKVDAVVHQ
uniref:Uncharacterized protein n=1 Tax=Arion vulgaris TaxID=1028688 RepID=A0A0B6YCB4_9EUPU